jgi:hypothetical protein
MQLHTISDADRTFRTAFEACTVAPAAFNHEAQVRLAYDVAAFQDSHLHPALRGHVPSETPLFMTSASRRLRA